jgi:hypothetical protein
MNFLENLPKIIEAFDKVDIHYALIGGLAMAMRGVQRATLDADFILLSENLESCDSILQKMGYRCEYQSENVSHYFSKNLSLGRIDFLHAFRPATLGMLKRADRIPFTEECSIPVVLTEDLIGLKIQASLNDPDRYVGDWNDIYMLIDHSARSGKVIDWELIQDYLVIFDLGDQLKKLKDRYGKIKQN